MVQCMYITLGQGQNNSRSQCLFHIIKILSICQLNASFVLQMQAAQCSLVQNIYFGLQKIGSLCPKNRRKIGNYWPKMAFL